MGLLEGLDGTHSGGLGVVLHLSISPLVKCKITRDAGIRCEFPRCPFRQVNCRWNVKKMTVSADKESQRVLEITGYAIQQIMEGCASILNHWY